MLVENFRRKLPKTISKLVFRSIHWKPKAPRIITCECSRRQLRLWAPRLAKHWAVQCEPRETSPSRHRTSLDTVLLNSHHTFLLLQNTARQTSDQNGPRWRRSLYLPLKSLFFLELPMNRHNCWSANKVNNKYVMTVPTQIATMNEKGHVLLHSYENHEYKYSTLCAWSQ